MTFVWKFSPWPWPSPSFHQAYATVYYETFTPEVSSIHSILSVNERVRKTTLAQPFLAAYYNSDTRTL